jgi:hypothetical protein
MLIAFCTVMLILLEGARREGRSALTLEYRYRLFALRDTLRTYAIEQPDLATNWVFMYLDSTITKLVSQLPSLSLWSTLALMLTYNHDVQFKRHRDHLEREYRKPKNQKFKQVEVELMATVGCYLGARHTGARVAFETLRACGRSVFFMRTLAVEINKKRKESLAVAIEAPETSTLRDYCPA